MTGLALRESSGLRVWETQGPPYQRGGLIPGPEHPVAPQPYCVLPLLFRKASRLEPASVPLLWDFLTMGNSQRRPATHSESS